MIQAITLENFRVHKKLVMNGITPLTLVSGKNNVGKSSLLEAVFALQAHRAPDVFNNLSALRGNGLENLLQSWESLFHKMNSDEPIRFGLQHTDETNSSLVFRKETNLSLVAIQNPDQSPAPVIGQSIAQERLPYAIRFEYKHEDYAEEGYYYADQLHTSVNIRTSREHNEQEVLPWTLLINPIGCRNEMGLIEWMGAIELKDKKDYIVDCLKMIDPATKDIFTAAQNGLTQLYVKKQEGVFPLKYAGDGFVKLLYLLSAILYQNNSLILIDEIENGLHYSMYEKVWEMIAKVAAENSSQIIATTHSYELITESCKGIKASGREQDFSFHRLEKRADETRDNCYNLELLDVAFQSDLEVR